MAKEISAEKQYRLKQASAAALPDEPAKAGMTPSAIKKALYAPFVGDGESLVSEINRIVRELNGELDLKSVLRVTTVNESAEKFSAEWLSDAEGKTIVPKKDDIYIVNGGAYDGRVFRFDGERYRKMIGSELKVAIGTVGAKRLPTATAPTVSATVTYDETEKNATLNFEFGIPDAERVANDGTGRNIAEQFAEMLSKIQGLRTDFFKVIPSTVSETNPIATHDFVNSSINNLAAFYITSSPYGSAFSTRADLIAAIKFYSGGKVRVPTQNDYAIVLSDESKQKGVDGSYPTTRYSYQGGTFPNGQWSFQYIVNNTSLTQAQVDAINSGITSSLVGKIGSNEDAINVLSQESKKNLYNLGAYDTYVSNGNGTGTVTRKTGVRVYRSEEVTQIFTATSFYYCYLDKPIDFLGYGNTQNIDFRSNKFTIRNGSAPNTLISYGEDYKFVAYFAIGTTLEQARQAIDGLIIQYERTAQYQSPDLVIENQPIRPANQEEEYYLHEEFLKGKNLLDYNKEISLTAGPNVFLEIPLPVKANEVYTISVQNLPDYVDAQLYTDNIGHYISCKEPITFSFSQVCAFRVGNYPLTQNATFIPQIMLTKGAIPYPYEPYYGEIARMGEVKEKFVSKDGSTINGNLNVNGNITLPTASTTENHIKTAIITGQGNATTRQYSKAHSIEMGLPDRNYMNFNEYGGIFNFYRTSAVYDKESGDGDLIAQINNGNLKISKAFLSKFSDNPIYILPYVPFGEIDTTHTPATYLKNLLKWICENYPNVDKGTWIGAVNPNSNGIVYIHIYNTNNVNSEGLPQYAMGFCQNLGNQIQTFSTQNYVYNYFSGFLPLEGGTLIGNVGNKDGQVIKGYKNVTPSTNMIAEKSGFYHNAFAQYGKYVLVGEDGDKFCIGWRYDGDYVNVKVSNNGSWVRDLKLITDENLSQYVSQYVPANAMSLRKVRTRISGTATSTLSEVNGKSVTVYFEYLEYATGEVAQDSDSVANKLIKMGYTSAMQGQMPVRVQIMDMFPGSGMTPMVNGYLYPLSDSFNVICGNGSTLWTFNIPKSGANLNVKSNLMTEWSQS